MPATYEIDRERRLVLSRGWGVFTEQDLLGHFTMLGADPAFQSTFSQLADLRSVEHAELRREFIRRHALEHLFDRNARRAIVVSSADHYELARIYAEFAQYASQNVHVFRDMHDAEAWLGLVTTVT
ncbi:MAG: hypothetical protein JF589_12550 [Gemmatimonadetes bacterium]|nr:hypothetical protein [Gemmatimonadota bacterium]